MAIGDMWSRVATLQQSLRAQAEASMPASSEHLTIKYHAKIPRLSFRYDFQFLAQLYCLGCAKVK